MSRMTFEDAKKLLGENSRKLAESGIILTMRRLNGKQSEEAQHIVDSYLAGKLTVVHAKDDTWVTQLKYKNGLSAEKKYLLMLGRRGSDVREGGVVGITSRALDLNEEKVQKAMVTEYIEKNVEFICQVDRNKGKAEARIQKRSIAAEKLMKAKADAKNAPKKEVKADAKAEPKSKALPAPGKAVEPKKEVKADAKVEPKKEVKAEPKKVTAGKTSTVQAQKDMQAKRAAAKTSPGRAA